MGNAIPADQDRLYVSGNGAQKPGMVQFDGIRSDRFDVVFAVERRTSAQTAVQLLFHAGNIDDFYVMTLYHYDSTQVPDVVEIDDGALFSSVMSSRRNELRRERKLLISSGMSWSLAATIMGSAYLNSQGFQSMHGSRQLSSRSRQTTGIYKCVWIAFLGKYKRGCP